MIWYLLYYKTKTADGYDVKSFKTEESARKWAIKNEVNIINIERVEL